MIRIINKYLFLIIYLFINNINNAFSQEPEVISISPSFNEIALSNNPEIKIDFNVPMDTSSFNNISFSVLGRRSGYHTGTIRFFNENKTITFNSEYDFSSGERVEVRLSSDILSLNGDSLNGFSWEFRVPVPEKELNFSDPVSYNGGGYGMQCVDMNNDISPDIVTSKGVILINDGNGAFPSYWYLGDSDFYSPIITEDFNRDGIMDVFYTNNDELILGLGDGNGNFNKSYYPFWFGDFISTDFNMDGYPDIAGFQHYNNNPPYDTTSYFSIALNDGTGHFIDTTIAGELTGYFWNMSTTDIENDGDKDIIIISHKVVTPNGIFGFEGLIVYRNIGNGEFEEYGLYPPCIYYNIYFPKYITAGDFNKDGLSDIAIMADMGGEITLNIGNGLYGDCDTNYSRSYWGAENAAPITAADFNGDNWIDLAISGYEWPPFPNDIPKYLITTNCNSYFNNCTGNSTFEDTLPSADIFSVASADLNKDSYLDIVHSGDGVHITYGKDITPLVNNYSTYPDDFILSQNYPNPFNPSTKISYSLPEDAIVSIKVYNTLGQEVAELFNGNRTAGYYEEHFDAGNLASGVYIYRITATKNNRIVFNQSKQMLLMK